MVNDAVSFGVHCDAFIWRDGQNTMMWLRVECVTVKMM
jgi:hypothetical protein